MKIVNLVRGNRRLPENRQAGVRKNSYGCAACCPIFTRHVTVVRGGRTPSEPVALVICSHAMKSIAARQFSFEVIDTRKFDARHSGLVVIAILVEPRNRIRTRTSVGRLSVLRNRGCASLRFGLCMKNRTR